MALRNANTEIYSLIKWAQVLSPKADELEKLNTKKNESNFWMRERVS